MAGLMSKLETDPDEVNKLVYVKGDDGSYRGWKTELLKEAISDKVSVKFLLCNYCGGVLRDACLFEINGKHENRCLLCIPEDTSKQPAHINRETIKEVQVQCPLKSKGCVWRSELNELLHHLEECGLFPVTCPLGCRDERGEVSRVERGEVETHKTCCPMRTVHCEYCAANVKSCEMNQYLEVCEEFPVPCPNECGQGFKMKRKDKSNHLSEECPLQLTECPYSQYGCEVKAQRMDLDLHEKEEMHKHCKLTMVMMSDMQNKVSRLEKEIELLRTLIPGRGIIEWKINGVQDKISQNEDTYSDPFYVGLYKFRGSIECDEQKSFVGIFLHIMKGEWDDKLKWPIKYKYPIVLINQLDANNNYEVNGEITEEDLEKYPECLTKPSSEQNEGLGRDKFISYANILQEKYSKDDTITIKISVEQILTPFS